jgi:hypothetical protein
VRQSLNPGHSGRKQKFINATFFAKPNAWPKISQQYNYNILKLVANVRQGENNKQKRS